MSHYSVALIVENLTDVDSMLEPYSEYLECDPYVKYTKEELIGHKRDEIERYKNGTYKEYLKDPIEYEKRADNPGHIDYLKNEFPKMLSYTDEQLYQDAIQYYEEDEIGENGEIFSTYNPKSKWDWYQVGGRFRSELLVKEDNTDVECHEVSEIERAMGNDREKVAPNGYKWVDGAKIKDIAFDVMKQEGRKFYDESIRFWEIIVEGQPLREGEEQPHNFYKSRYYTERYQTKEQYARVCATFHTFALLTEDGWCEKGEMGWFGLNSSTGDSEDDFLEVFQKVIQKPENQNKYLVIVDCHI